MGEQKDIREEALKAAEETPETIVRHLRLMARGKQPYKFVLFLSPWARNILHAAADLIAKRRRWRE
jgi:hypothetical protein